MLCLICRFLLYIPIIQAVKVRIDGVVNIEKNWDTKLPSFAEILRMSNISETTTNSSIKSKGDEQKYQDILSYIRGYPVTDSSESPPQLPKSRKGSMSGVIRPLRNIYNALIDERTNGRRNPDNSILGGIQEFILDSFPDLKTWLGPPVESNATFKSQPANKAKAKLPLRYKLVTKKKPRERTDRIKLATRKLPRMRRTKSTATTTYITEGTTKNTRRRMSKYSREYTKKNKKLHNNYVTRKKKTTFHGRFIDTTRTADMTRRQKPQLHPRFTVISQSPASYTGEPYQQTGHQIARSNVNLVKNNKKIKMFTINVFNQNIKVFNTIRSNIKNTDLKNKIDSIKKIYRDKFADFVENNQNQKIVTNLGTQKVVLNTIETSNRIMRRLFNFFIAGMEEVLPDRDALMDLWSKQIKAEEQQEYTQACQLLNVCRLKYCFSSVLAEIVSILLKVDNIKLQQAIDALGEVLKNIKLSNLLNKSMQVQFLRDIEAIERSESGKIKILLIMFRNMLVNKNKPLVVRHNVLRSVVNQTVALLDAIDLLDAKLLTTDENVSQWNDLQSSLLQWANGQGGNILGIMQALVNMVSRGIKNMNKEMAREFYTKFQMFLRSTSTTFIFYK